MPTIKNKTKTLLVFPAIELDNESFDTVAIPIGQAKPMPAKMWAEYAKRPNIEAEIASRRILVIHNQSADATEQTSSSSEASSDAPPNPDEETKGGWAAMHWKTAEKMIAVEGNKATLEKLLENETRPKFIEMLSERIEELEADANGDDDADADGGE